MFRRSIVALVALLAVTASACADAPAADPPGSGSSPQPTDPSELVLRVTVEGGYTTVDYQLTILPTFSLYADGTIITPGPQIEIYPPPALPALESRTVSAEGVDAIVAAAIAAGLGDVGDLTDMGSVGVADAPDTVITLHTDEIDTTVRVYALSDLQERPPGMSQDEFDARTALNTFVTDLGRLDAWVPEGSIQDEAEPYEASSARIFVQDYQGNDDLTQEPIAWPLEPALETFGEPSPSTGGFRCDVVSGSDWSQHLAPAAQPANQLTPWTSEGEPWSVLFRPLLPDETGC